jgi:anti-sigma B factor antagonist
MGRRLRNVDYQGSPRDRRFFQVCIDPLDDGVVVTPEGELDLRTAPSLSAAIEEARAHNEGVFVLDLGSLTFMDSIGLRLVLELTKTFEREGRPMTVWPGDRPVQRVFDVTGVTDRIPWGTRPSPTEP